MRGILAAILLAFTASLVSTTADAARRHQQRHHAELRSPALRSQLSAMKMQIADLRKEITGLRNVWGAVPFQAGPQLASLTPPSAPIEQKPAPASDIDEARAYLCATAHPGGTMTRLGCEKAIGLLHPDFARHLADAVREARAGGLISAGVYSAYRPPGFGVGGFSDKYRSLHSYGLAVDVYGIGGPCSASARRWHKIAAGNGVVGPYGACNRAEFNHMQATRTRSAPSSLRKTITSQGPLDPERMWDAAKGILTAALGIVPNLFGERTRVRHVRRHRHHHRRA